jgi:hypothetical protein
MIVHAVGSLTTALSSVEMVGGLHDVLQGVKSFLTSLPGCVCDRIRRALVLLGNLMGRGLLWLFKAPFRLVGYLWERSGLGHVVTVIWLYVGKNSHSLGHCGMLVIGGLSGGRVFAEVDQALEAMQGGGAKKADHGRAGGRRSSEDSRSEAALG